MATSLIEYENIQTTVSKAKALRPLIDKLINIAKKGDLTARRRISAVLYKPKMVEKLLTMASDRFSDRNCGYTLIAKNGFRAGDAAPMCYLALTNTTDFKAATGIYASVKSDRSRRVAASKAAVSQPKEAKSESATSDSNSADN
jgi:large subunit ribosomal protein L17